jgi:hypothetical protein
LIKKGLEHQAQKEQCKNLSGYNEDKFAAHAQQ